MRTSLILFLLSAAVICSTIFLTLTLFAKGNEEQPSLESSPGLLQMSSMQSFGPLQMPAALFPHDRHTQALSGPDLTCSSCHPRLRDQLVFTYKTTRVDTYQAGKKLFHTECIGCHSDRRNQELPTGPPQGECRSCHNQEKAPLSGWKPAAFNLNMHARHVRVYADSCQTCHHRVSEQNKQLVPGPGEELGCRACHLESGEQSRIVSLERGLPETLFTPELSRDYLQSGRPLSLRRAAHLSCLGCHLERQDRDQESGPQTCAGCHSRAGQSEFEPLESRERLQRGQPDWTLIGPGYGKVPETGKQSGKMAAVPFNHKGHEQEASTCRSCHHLSQLQKCRDCHTPKGIEAGDFVGLTRAMHLETDARSCRGCHREIVLNRPQCAGCHKAREFEEGLMQGNCQNCHLSETPEQTGDLSQQQESELAESLRKSFLSGKHSLDLDEIPEKVEIGGLSRQYGPVTFPHRLIARKLQAVMTRNRLAAAFHPDKTALCRGCHHHSPPSANPPPCMKCHSGLVFKKTPDRPGLKGAYHGQCMDCHTWMGIKEPANTDCTACHEQLSEQVIADELY